MKAIWMLFFMALAAACGNSKGQSGASGDENGRKPAGKLPSCSRLCPENEKVLPGRPGRFSYLSFENFGWRGVGRCRGHVIVSQKMTLLAKFVPGSLECEREVLSDECVLKASEAIDDILNYKARTISGFKNLLSFSSRPEIKTMLKNAVKNVSHRYRAVKGHIEDEGYQTEELNVFHEVKRRVLLNHLPYVAIYGDNVGHHALMAYSASVKGGRAVLCARDPNVVESSKEGEACQNFLFHDADGNVFYQKGGQAPERLYEFSIFSDEDRRVERYISARRALCVEEAKMAGKCH